MEIVLDEMQWENEQCVAELESASQCSALMVSHAHIKGTQPKAARKGSRTPTAREAGKSKLASASRFVVQVVEAGERVRDVQEEARVLLLLPQHAD